MAPEWKGFRCPFCQEEIHDGRLALSSHLTGHFEDISVLKLPARDATAENAVHAAQQQLRWAVWFGDNTAVKKAFDDLAIVAMAGRETDARQADLNFRDENGQTLLFMAVKQRWEGVVKLLLNAGDISVNMGSSDGKTPLSSAVTSGNSGIVRLLLKTGRVMVRPDEGKRMLESAVLNGHHDVAALVIDTGEVGLTQNDGNYVLRTVIQRRDELGVWLFAKLIEAEDK